MIYCGRQFSMQAQALMMTCTLLGFIALSVAALPPWLNPINPTAPAIIPRSSRITREMGTAVENRQALSAFNVRITLQAVPLNTNCENRGETRLVSLIADSVEANPKLTDDVDSTLSLIVGDWSYAGKSNRRTSLALVDTVSSRMTTHPYFGAAGACNNSAKSKSVFMAEGF